MVTLNAVPAAFKIQEIEKSPAEDEEIRAVRNASFVETGGVLQSHVRLC